MVYYHQQKQYINNVRVLTTFNSEPCTGNSNYNELHGKQSSSNWFGVICSLLFSSVHFFYLCLWSLSIFFVVSPFHICFSFLLPLDICWVFLNTFDFALKSHIKMIFGISFFSIPLWSGFCLRQLNSITMLGP